MTPDSLTAVMSRGGPRPIERALAEVDTIVAMADPVLRNLRITQCYHELSRAFADRFLAGDEQAYLDAVDAWHAEGAR